MPDFFETFDDLTAWDDGGPSTQDLYITRKHATDGDTSLRATYDTVYGGQGFFLQWIDTVDGGDPATTYWLTYSFYIEDWERVWGNGDRASVIPLPMFAHEDTFVDYGGVYLGPLSQTTGELFWGFPFNLGSQSVSAGAWHTLRIGLQYDDGTNTTTCELWIDGTQVDTNVTVGGAPHYPAPPVGVNIFQNQNNVAGVVFIDDLHWSVSGDPGEPSTTETGDGSTTEQWVKIRDKDSGDDAALAIDIDPTFSNAVTDAYVHANIYVPQSLLDRLVADGNSLTQPLLQTDGANGLRIEVSHSNTDGSTCRWRQAGDTAFGVVTAGWHTVAAHIVAGDPNLELWIDGVQYNKFYSSVHTAFPNGINVVKASYPYPRSGAISSAQTDMWVGYDELAVALTDWVTETNYDYRFPLQNVTRDDVFYTDYLFGDPPSYPPYWGDVGPADDVTTLEEGGFGPGPGLPSNSVAVDFIAPGTTLYTPSLTGAGNVDINAPFIAPATTVFDPYLSGDMDAPVDFIAPTTVVFTPSLLGANTARITQVPVEVVVSPEPEARITQVPVEVVLEGDPSARVTQVPVEVIMRNLRETVSIIIWD